MQRRREQCIVVNFLNLLEVAYVANVLKEIHFDLILPAYTSTGDRLCSLALPYVGQILTTTAAGWGICTRL
ncbi:hypothetical protein Q8A67_012286 [Cirrhinus molitorella]|uniref:Uncharacterized protein n=1 Tax=Cirrhinus molitorella TaxID=172907 RepID=A0AA88TX99_9TELE|nr:hypothetical protein Q8A67_012286 [Cirrhinus molitorella]